MNNVNFFEWHIRNFHSGKYCRNIVGSDFKSTDTEKDRPVVLIESLELILMEIFEDW